ncbi:MAG: hypothetical protein HKL86_11095 [Acidimicrobiaceae bacterium]|nr:hypothetical protein [Acidimicrobiaceae bacterium]
MTTFGIELSSARSWSEEEMEDLFAEGFPEFIDGDKEVKKYIARVRESFKEYDLVLTDERNELAATGWGVPITWSGEVGQLPLTFADALRQSVELHDASGVPNTLVIGGAVVHPARKGSGVAESLIGALCDTATAHQLGNVIAPVRPTRKHLYPLMDIDHYAAWRRSDAKPWDPWLRLHVRIGGQIIAIARQAQTMTASVSQWEEWTRLELPDSGDYIIPKGMSPLHIDKMEDLGTYVEPNIWVRHR